eukprot:1323317-Amorphochlora_amoeboformis.AAC.1
MRENFPEKEIDRRKKRRKTERHFWFVRELEPNKSEAVSLKAEGPCGNEVCLLRQISLRQGVTYHPDTIRGPLC